MDLDRQNKDSLIDQPVRNISMDRVNRNRDMENQTLHQRYYSPEIRQM